MTQLDKEVAIIDLYYENAELSLANDLYLNVFCESGDSGGIAGFVRNLVQKFKDFIHSIQNRIQYNKLKKSLEAYRNVHITNMGGSSEKNLIRDADKVLKLGEEQVLAIYKLYSSVLTHKIDHARFNEEMKRLDVEYESKLQAIQSTVDKVRKAASTGNGKQPTYNAQQILNVLDYQNKAIQRIQDAVCKIDSQFKNAKDETAVEATAAAQKITARGRMTTQTILKILGITAVATTFLAVATKVAGPGKPGSKRYMRKLNQEINENRARQPEREKRQAERAERLAQLDKEVAEGNAERQKYVADALETVRQMEANRQKRKGES